MLTLLLTTVIYCTPKRFSSKLYIYRWVLAGHHTNIFLHTYEYEYLQTNFNNGQKEVARNISKTFRYQDEFGKHFSKIDPPEMNLEPPNLLKCVVTFLYLRISIFRGKFSYRSYDKRDNFGFVICNFQNLNGNVDQIL